MLDRNCLQRRIAEGNVRIKRRSRRIPVEDNENGRSYRQMKEKDGDNYAGPRNGEL